MDRNNNDLLMLGISILILGLLLATYSIAAYSETKTLSSKIDFQSLEEDNQMSDSDKYYKYLSIADFLNQKLNKNKNLLIKNATCNYLDYAQHNAIELYKLTNKRTEEDTSRKNVAAGNIRGLYNMLNSYKTCKQADNYQKELQNILDEIQSSENSYNDNDMRMDKFLNGYNKNNNVQSTSDTIQENIPQNTESINIQTQEAPQQEQKAEPAAIEKNNIPSNQ